MGGLPPYMVFIRASLRQKSDSSRRAFGKITHFPCRSVRRQLRSEIGGYYRVAERSVGGLRNETQKVFSKLWRVSGGELFFGLGKAVSSPFGR